MTSLPGALREADIQTERRRIGVGAKFIPDEDWQYQVSFRPETKQGTKRAAGSFFFNAAQFLEPVDYVTDQIDASASHSTARWQATFAYHGTIFRDQNDSLTWQNPFTPVFAGADTGQRSLPPDNQFHQLLASMAYQWTRATRVLADLAAGRGRQDDDFLPATVNPNLVVGALPRAELGGRVA